MATDAASSEKSRPTWAELKEQAPGLCEAVVGWIREQAHGYALGELLRGKTIDGRPIMADFARGEWRQFNHPHDPQRPGAQLVQRVRLRAAEYRMEAAACFCVPTLVRAARAKGLDLAVDPKWSGSALHLVSADESWKSTLADALDAAADEAERLVGGET